MAVLRTSPITEADLLRLNAADGRVEVIDGEGVPMTPVGLLHALVAGSVYRALYAYAAEHRLGYVMGDSLIYVLDEDPQMGIRQTRIPDASFIRKGRLPAGDDLARPFAGAPDLAVEVLSPEDSALEMLAKVRTYFEAGTAQVWLVYPAQQEVHCYHREAAAVQTFRAADTISAEALFPGLKLAVADLFALPDVED